YGHCTSSSTAPSSDLVVGRGGNAAVVDPVPGALVHEVDDQLHERVGDAHLGREVPLAGQHVDDRAGDEGRQETPGERLQDAAAPGLERHQRVPDPMLPLLPSLRAISVKTALFA